MSEIQLLDKIHKDQQIIDVLNDSLDNPNYTFFIGEYKVLKHIDSGAFGSVFKGFDRQNQKPVAIKIINISQMFRKHPSEIIREKLKRYLQTEQLLMKQCRSAFVVKLYESFQNSKCKVLIMEYCRNGSLQHYIKERGGIDEEDAVTILRQIILGLSELHRNNIIHRDLKPANILIHNDVFKIADFGLSKQVKDASVQEKGTYVGSKNTMAPEVARGSAYGFKADIWSIGIIYFMMVYPENQLNQRFIDAIKFAKEGGNFKFKSITGKLISEQSSNFLKSTIVQDSSLRMNWQQTLEHPLFKMRFERMPSVYLVGLDDAFTKQIKNKKEILQKDAFELQKDLIDFEKLRAQSQKMIASSQGFGEQDILWQLDAKLLNEQYLQCRISEFIYYEIFVPIEKKNFLRKDVRFHVEFMFLLLNRCKENIISAKTIVDRKYPEEVAIQFCNQVSPLFQIISEKFEEIATLLTSVQNKFQSIIKDRISKIFHPQIFKEKQKFLNNFQRKDFVKSQQLRFTCQRYILDIVNQIKGESKIDQIKMKKLIKSYKQINEIKLEDLIEKRIQKRIESILNQNQ